MAKIVGLVGAVSGKVGNFVGAVVGGVQTMRVYQPVVANPRTTGQVKQRSRVDLAGQLSAAISKVAIEGLPGNARQRRSMLLSNLIKSTSTAITSASGRATLLGASVEFAKGNIAFAVLPATPVPEVDQQGGIKVEYDLTSRRTGAEGEADVVRVVTLAVPKDDASLGAKPVSSVMDLSIPDTGNVVRSTVLMTPTAGTEYVVFAYYIPMRITNPGALSWGYIQGIQGAGEVVLNGNETQVGAFLFGNSVYGGAHMVS